MTRPPYLRPGVRAHLAAAVRLGWRGAPHLAVAIRLAVGHLLAAIVALVVIFWEWGWKPLAALLGVVARLRPFAALETLIRGLPPYLALAVFALPSLLLLPLKLFAFYLMAQGFKAAAAGLFVAAKVVGTALVARIYMLTEVALMQIGWFRRAHGVVMPLKAALTSWVRDSAVWQFGRQVKQRMAAVAAPLVARARAALALLRARLFNSR
jgi:hypothetical protein